jgi:hypothetical protein
MALACCPQRRVARAGNPFLELHERDARMGNSLAFFGETPAAIRPVKHRPDPEKRPKNVERKKAHPAGDVDRILMRMMAVHRDLVGNVMDSDDPVEQNKRNGDQYPEGKIIKKHPFLPCAQEQEAGARNSLIDFKLSE